MSATITPVESEFFTALKSFITDVIGNGGTSAPIEVILGLDNRVPMPQSPFIAMTPLFQKRLATNVDSFGVSSQSSEMSAQVDIQIDAYGPNALSWTTMLSTLLRDDTGCVALAPTCQPLYADDPKQMPLIDAEQQYEKRWSLDAAFQWSPVTTDRKSVV